MVEKDFHTVYKAGKAIYNPIEGKWEKQITYDHEGNIKVETTKNPIEIRAVQMKDKIAQFSNFEQQSTQLKDQAVQFGLQGQKLFSRVKEFLEEQNLQDNHIDGGRLGDQHNNRQP